MTATTPNMHRDLNLGNRGERYVFDTLERLGHDVNTVKWMDDPNTQRDGIDGYVNGLAVDVKTQRSKYLDSPNILVEMLCDVDNQKPGWLHNQKTDWVLWSFASKDGIHPFGWAMPHTPSLERFVVNYIENDLPDFKRVQNRTWASLNCVIPIDDWPRDMLIPVAFEQLTTFPPENHLISTYDNQKALPGETRFD